MTTPHTRKVLQLYRWLLRLHQLLPGNMGYIGGQFVKDEFRRHKTAGPEYVVSFMKEWTVSGTSLVCVEATGSLVCVGATGTLVCVEATGSLVCVEATGCLVCVEATGCLVSRLISLEMLFSKLRGHNGSGLGRSQLMWFALPKVPGRPVHTYQLMCSCH